MSWPSGRAHNPKVQRDALGRAHGLFRSLHVGVVGLGGIGSPLAEQLLRMGPREMTIIDSDRLDSPSNVRRVFGATSSDPYEREPPSKVDVVGAHLDRIGLDTVVNRIAGDIREESVFRALLDSDVVLNATDTHGSRAIVNDLASTYMMPVVDVGGQAGGTSKGELAALVAEIRILTPVTPCLWCRDVISADVVRAENLPDGELKSLIEEGYLVSFGGQPAPSVAALTVLASGMASCALLSLLTSEGEVCPSGYLIDGLMGDALEMGPADPLAGCRCRARLGAGDSKPPSFIR